MPAARGIPSPERSVPVGEARRRIELAVVSLGLTPRLRRLGGHSASAWYAELVDSTGRPVPDAEGLGKGLCDVTASTGALAEALEHFASNRVALEGTIRFVSPKELIHGPFADDGFCLAFESESAELPCVDFWPVAGKKAAPLSVPVGTFLPWYVENRSESTRLQLGDSFDYSLLWRYCSNSGTALGVGREEALLHGVNEVVERDAFSLFLLRHLVGTWRKDCLIDVKSVNRALSDAIAEVQLVVGCPVALIDLTTDLGIPTILAYASDGAKRWRGLGTSLSWQLAVGRAVTELAQDFYFTREGWRVERSAGDEVFGIEIVHPHCPNLDGVLRSFTLMTDHLDSEVGSVESQLAEVLARLDRRGFGVWSRELAQFDSSITVEHVVVPGLERFVLTTAGNLVVPGARGMNEARRLRGGVP
jgi:ribosomal protein S12 methylthiotransferase accessory factor